MIPETAKTADWPRKVKNALTGLSGRIAEIEAGGGSTSSAAVGFLPGGTGGDLETVQDALRREVWADQYKLTSDADDVACITRAVTALLAAGGGGVVRLSRRHYTLASAITFTGINNVRIVGAGNSSSGTMLRSTQSTGDTITFSNCQHCELSGVQFWPTVRKTSGYAVKLTGGSYACKVDFRCDYGWNGLLIEDSSEARFSINCRYMLGTVGTRFAGSSGSYRAIGYDILGDNPYPQAAIPSKVKTFTNGMTLVAGDIFVANNAIYQCITGGTAGASAPSGYPSGTTPDSVFTTNLTSGTAAIRFVCHSALTWLETDSYGYSLVINNAALLNGAYGVRMIDTAATGSSYPIWMMANNLETDHSFYAGVSLERGEGVYLAGNVWIGSCLTGNGVTIGPNHRGDIEFTSTCRVMGNAQNGILRQAGPVHVMFNGVQCTDNSVLAAGTYHGLNISASSSGTHVVGGTYGDSVSVSGNNQGYGIFLGNTTTNTAIIGANVRGNTTGGINVGTGHTSLSIAECPGHNPGSLVTITVGSSPFAWTNSTGSDVQLNVANGTVSLVSLDGYAVARATDTQVIVPRDSVATVTYSSLPVMLYRVL